MPKKSIEQLVTALSKSQEGNKELHQELQEKAQEMGLSLRFVRFAFGPEDFDVHQTGPVWWDIDGQWIDITPEEYLDALREYLTQELASARQSEMDLRYLIMRFSKKKARFQELKREGREPK